MSCGANKGPKLTENLTTNFSLEQEVLSSFGLYFAGSKVHGLRSWTL